jgi:hypothetical protein
MRTGFPRDGDLPGRLDRVQRCPECLREQPERRAEADRAVAEPAPVEFIGWLAEAHQVEQQVG